MWFSSDPKANTYAYGKILEYTTKHNRLNKRNL